MRMSGFSKEWTRNLGWLEAIHSEDAILVRKAMEKAIRLAKLFDFEYRVRDADGEWGWMRSRGSPRLGENGKVLSWYGCIEDIDDYRQLADDLRESQAQLQSLFQVVRKQIRNPKESEKLVLTGFSCLGFVKASYDIQSNPTTSCAADCS
jgi:PAS domain S-box-containing protein